IDFLGHLLCEFGNLDRPIQSRQNVSLVIERASFFSLDPIYHRKINIETAEPIPPLKHSLGLCSGFAGLNLANLPNDVTHPILFESLLDCANHFLRCRMVAKYVAFIELRIASEHRTRLTKYPAD